MSDLVDFTEGRGHAEGIEYYEPQCTTVLHLCMVSR